MKWNIDTVFFLMVFLLPIFSFAQEIPIINYSEGSYQIRQREGEAPFKKEDEKSPNPSANNNYSFVNFLGIDFSTGYSLGDKKIRKHPNNINLQGSLSYVPALFWGKLPLIGFQVNIGSIYAKKFHSSDTWTVLPTLSLGVRVHMASSFYLSGGAHIAFNLQSEKIKAVVGPYVGLGGVVTVDHFAMDIGLRWSYFPEGSDMNKIPSNTTGTNYTSSQSINFVLGFYGLI